MATKADSKNFFYDVEVISFDGKRQAKLTEKIKRLIESIEIQEVDTTGDTAQYLNGQATINLRETQYLPQDDNLRPQELDVFGQITNRPASIMDLRFDTEKGYTFVSQEEMESGTTQANRNQKSKEEPVVFLFQTRNKLRITWGYLEPFLSRTEEFEIENVEISGGSTDNGRVKIQALNRELEFMRAKPEEGIVFTNIVEQPKVPYRRVQPLSLKQTLFRITKALGVTLIFDGEEVTTLPPRTLKFDLLREDQNDTAPADKPFRISAKQSYWEFINTLASDFQSYVKFRIVNDEPILFFNKTSIEFAKSRKTLRYLDKDGLVQNYSIQDRTGKEDSPVTGNSVTEEGKRKKSEYVTAALKQGNETPPKRYDQDQNKAHERELGTKRVGHSETIPSESKDRLNMEVEAKSYESSYISTLALTTTGDPFHDVGLYDIENIGVRYSGTYKMYSVKHSMNTSGYTNSFQGKRQKLSEGGVEAQSQAADNETDNDGFLEERLSGEE